METTIKIKGMPTLSRLLAGFLYTCAGGLGPAAVYLWHSFGDWNGYFKPQEFLQLISSGAGPLAAMWWLQHQREVKAALKIPDETLEELAALREIKEQYRRQLDTKSVAPIAQIAEVKP